MAQKRPKILVVDDEESMVFSIRDYLSSYADCLGATSYEEAISILEGDKGISVVISDIRMPDKDGFDLLMWLRNNRPQMKVVMITAYGSPSVRALAKQKGAVMYLEKPLDLEQLMQVVRKLLERKGFSVSLKDMELADVLQFLSFANKAVRVQVFNALGEGGEIGLDGEEILWIRSATHEGEEAFYEIMSWEGGSFEVYSLAKEQKPSEEEKLPFPLSFLLLEEARRRDEAVFSMREKGEATPSDQEEGVGIDIAELAEWRGGVDGFVESALTNKGLADAVKKETKAAFSVEQPVEVQLLIRDLKRASLDLDAFLAELQGKKYSGELRSTTPEGHYRILFYQGLPLVSSSRTTPPMREFREIMDVPDATLNFYLLGDELTHALLSVLQGEKVWQGLAVNMFHLDKMQDKLMEESSTGHLCIHKENGDRHYCFFFQGIPLGFYDIEKHWIPVDIATMWEDARQVDYYLSGKIESFLSTAVTMRSSEGFREFISLWNDLTEGIAKKMGRKPVGKSLEKNFGGLDVYTLEGIRLHLAGENNQGAYNALEDFRERVPGFLKEMEIIVGRHWLNDHLQEFREKHGDIIDRLSLIEVFSTQGR